jgi:hypothetical protein
LGRHGVGFGFRFDFGFNGPRLVASRCFTCLLLELELQLGDLSSRVFKAEIGEGLASR